MRELIGRRGWIGRHPHKVQALQFSNLASDLGRVDILCGGDLRGSNAWARSDHLKETQRARSLLLTPRSIERGVGHEQRANHRADIVPTCLHLESGV